MTDFFIPDMTPSDRQAVIEGDSLPELRKKLAAQSPVHEMFHQVLENLGGLEFVTDWAISDPDRFMQIYARLSPAPKEQRHSGKLQVEVLVPESPLDNYIEAEVVSDSLTSAPTAIEEKPQKNLDRVPRRASVRTE